MRLELLDIASALSTSAGDARRAVQTRRCGQDKLIRLVRLVVEQQPRRLRLVIAHVVVGRRNRWVGDIRHCRPRGVPATACDQCRREDATNARAEEQGPCSRADGTGSYGAREVGATDVVRPCGTGSERLRSGSWARGSDQVERQTTRELAKGLGCTHLHERREEQWRGQHHDAVKRLEGASGSA